MLFSLRAMISSARSSRPSSPYSSSMRTTCAAQTWLAAICERMSPFTCSGVRTLARIMSSTPWLSCPRVVELDQRDEQAFLEYLAVVRGDPPADVRVVQDAGGKGGETVAMEDRAQHADVVQVAGERPGVIGDVHVARPEGVRRQALHQLLDAERHRARLAGRGERALRKFPPARVREHAGVVVRVAQQAGERRACDRRVGFIDDRDQPSPEDLQCDRVKARLNACRHGFAPWAGRSTGSRTRPPAPARARR